MSRWRRQIVRRRRRRQALLGRMRAYVQERIDAAIAQALGPQPEWVDVAPPEGATEAQVNVRTGILRMKMKQPLERIMLTIKVGDTVVVEEP